MDEDVTLTHGHTVTFGTWVAIHPDELQKVFATWWTADYPLLELDGLLANQIPPWDVLGAPVHLGQRNTDCDAISVSWCAVLRRRPNAAVVPRQL